jgi:hypothetical protein
MLLMMMMMMKTMIRHVSLLTVVAFDNIHKVKQSRYTPWRRLGGEEI